MPWWGLSSRWLSWWRWWLSLQAISISKTKRISPHKTIQIQPIHSTRRVRLQPPPQPRRVVTCPIIIKPRTIIPFLTAIAVFFELHLPLTPTSNKSRTPIGKILLITNNLSIIIHLQSHTTEVITHLKTQLCCSYFVNFPLQIILLPIMENRHTGITIHNS